MNGTSKNFEDLKEYIRKEVEDLNTRAQNENSERSESIRGLSGEMKETANCLEKKISHLEEQVAKNQREIRQQLLDQSKAISEEIRELSGKLAAAIEKATHELSMDKVGRSTLAALFSEVALRLNNEFHIEGLEDVNEE